MGVGIGVTGTMGNVDPANPGTSKPGQVWFALCLCAGGAPDGGGARSANPAAATRAFHLELPPQPARPGLQARRRAGGA